MSQVKLPADFPRLWRGLVRRVDELELAVRRPSKPDVQRAYTTGNTDSAWNQGGDITSDGTNRLQLEVTPTEPVWWVVSFRALVDNDFATWRRFDAGLYLDPVDAVSGQRSHHAIGTHHEGVNASDYWTIGGTAYYALDPGVAYTVGIRLTWANGVQWQYHRSPEHTYLFGHTLKR